MSDTELDHEVESSAENITPKITTNENEGVDENNYESESDADSAECTWVTLTGEDQCGIIGNTYLNNPEDEKCGMDSLSGMNFATEITLGSPQKVLSCFFN